MSMLDRLIDDAENSAQTMNFESSTIDYCNDFEALEMEEKAQLQSLEAQEVQNLVNRGMKKNVALNQARLKVNTVASAIQSGALAKVPSAPATPFQPMPRNVRGKKVAATFTINIKRLTDNITENLPVVLFGKTFSVTAYSQLLQGLLPSGVTLAGVQIGAVNTNPSVLANTTANTLKIRFAFTDGTGNDDILEVTCNEVPMPTFVDANTTDSFAVGEFRYKISDTSQQAQYDIPVSFKRKTMFGKGGEQTLTPSTYINPTDFKDNLVKVGQPFEIDKDSWVETSIVPLSGFQVSLSFNVSAFVRDGANLL